MEHAANNEYVTNNEYMANNEYAADNKYAADNEYTADNEYVANNEYANNNEISNNLASETGSSSVQTESSNNSRQPLTDIWEEYDKIDNGARKYKGASCRYCDQKWARGRAYDMKSHLAIKCKGKIPREIWFKVLQELQSEHVLSELTTSKKRKSVYFQLPVDAYYDTKEAIDKAKETRANQSLVKWIVSSGISFSAFDNPYFEDYTKELNPGYNPPKRAALSTSILDAEAANIIIKIEQELSKAKNLTLCIDGWNSYSASAALREEIIFSLTLGGNLKSPTKTRWSTAWDFCESILCNEANIKSVLEQQPQIFIRASAVKSLINDRQFWIDVEQLRNILGPVKRAVKNVEFRTTILADIFFELVKMAIAIQETSVLYNSQFRYDCIAIYNKRWKEFDFELYLLSFFLHPTYRGDFLEVGIYKNYVFRKAMEIWKKIGGGDISAGILKFQLNLYKNHRSPFEDEFIPSTDMVTDWWMSVELKRNEDHIKTLALKVHSILPHNAAFENAKSELNYVDQKLRQEDLLSIFDRITSSIEDETDLFSEEESYSFLDELAEENMKEDEEELEDLVNENSTSLEVGNLISLSSKLEFNESSSLNEEVIHGNKDFDINDLINDLD
ncbi:9144_t:CDS:2 [Dentiscutata erythropus]|uniref:9144_t:CDS:1 n=1 Tax=Dentiscutata erythropus TaxID=1348616 RepID=A0A9N9H7B8_9GLOM|nr:9144_t:CDS:2 [Dentiscutata erythropus]